MGFDSFAAGGGVVTVSDQHLSSLKTNLARAKSALRGLLFGQVRIPRRPIAEQPRLHEKSDTPKDDADRSHAKLSAIDKDIEKLFAAPPVEWTPKQQIFLMRALNQLDLLSERALNRLMARLLANREIALVNSLIDDATLGHDLVRDYYRLALADYNADDSINLKDVVDLYQRAHNSFLRFRILNKLLTVSAKFGDIDIIENALSGLQESDYPRLDKVSVLGVSRLLIKQEHYETAASLLSRYLDEKDRSLWLYYIEPLLSLEDSGMLSPALKDFCAALRPSIDTAAAELLRSTYQGVDDIDRANFERLIVKVICDLEKHSANLMNVRFSAAQRDALVQEIKDHLVEERPLSLIRLNDGEAYAFEPPEVEGIDSGVFAKDNEIRERHWWGAHPSPQTREDIVMRVRHAVERCDILGLPSVYRVARDLPKPGQRYGEGRSQRGLLVVLNACESVVSSGKRTVTEERCHQVAIDESMLQRLASWSKSVVIVSCWAPGQLHLPFPAQHITVPAPQKLKRLNSANAPQLFQIYPDVLTQIREVAAPGVLVLVGAGIIGKFLVGEARECGAVAIDIGSMLDYMAGSKTRSIADLI